MFEHTPPTIEDPLPLTTTHGEYLPHPDEKYLPSELGGYPVSDPRDPILWKNVNNEKISKDAVHVLWAVYRERSGMPTDEDDMKWRDRHHTKEYITALISQLSEADLNAFLRYQEHLDALDQEDAEKRLAVLSMVRINQVGQHMKSAVESAETIEARRARQEPRVRLNGRHRMEYQ